MCRNGTKRSLPTPFPNSSKRDKRRGRMGDVGAITLLVLQQYVLKSQVLYFFYVRQELNLHFSMSNLGTSNSFILQIVDLVMS